MRAIRLRPTEHTVAPRLGCEEARLLLSCCLDGEVNDLERASAARHIRTCGSCREFLHEAEEFREALRLEAAVSPTPERAASRTLAVVLADMEQGRCGAEDPRDGALGALRRVRRRVAGVSAGISAAPRRIAVATILLILMIATAVAWPHSHPASRQVAALPLPRVTAGRNLDPSYVPYLDRNLAGGRIVVAGTADEKLLFFQSPMSFHEEYHYRPEDL